MRLGAWPRWADGALNASVRTSGLNLAQQVVKCILYAFSVNRVCNKEYYISVVAKSLLAANAPHFHHN